MKSVGEHVDAVGIRGDIGRTRAEECAGVVGLERRRKVRRIARYVRAVAAVETETKLAIVLRCFIDETSENYRQLGFRFDGSNGTNVACNPANLPSAFQAEIRR